MTFSEFAYSWEGASVAIGVAGVIVSLKIPFAFYSARRIDEHAFGKHTARARQQAIESVAKSAHRQSSNESMGWFFIGGALFWIDYQRRHGAFGWAWLCGILFLIGITQLFIGRRPTVVLVLGVSNATTMKLQAKLRDIIAPFFRPISLMQTGDMGDDMTIAGDCYRITETTTWEKAVMDICRVIPIIAIDLRESSEQVSWELKLVENNYLGRTLFLGGASDSSAMVFDEEWALCEFIKAFLYHRASVSSQTTLREYYHMRHPAKT